MRLFEIEDKKSSKTKTKTDQKSTIGTDDLLNKPFHSPSVVGKDDSSDTQMGSDSDLRHHVSSKTQTKDKMSKVTMPTDDRAMRHYMDLIGNIDQIDTSGEDDIESPYQDPEPDVPTPETLPAVISKGMRADYGDIDLNWHMVKNLPGYFQKAIRAMGRQVFSPFTSTPIEDIQVLANVNDSGPNEQSEINKLASYLRSKGHRDSDAELLFSEVVPGYSADAVIYHADGFTFMLVKDFAGSYVYAWPEEERARLSSVNRNRKLH